KMPSLLKPEQSADSIIKGIQTSKFEIHFSKKFTIIIKLIAALPYKLYFKIDKKMI
ncbi:oxidoreductase, partial [Francisella tularensis subsp. holarctica]|nr:oxidoreductase [Francisella tularensis subsp. holarctica]